jgi:hypothetical protein
MMGQNLDVRSIARHGVAAHLHDTPFERVNNLGTDGNSRIDTSNIQLIYKLN